MIRIHQEIIKEISEEMKKDKSVIGMVVFGSCSTGKERKNSDIDLEIISKTTKKEIVSKKEKRRGIKIDIEIIPKKTYLDITNKYPYLWYDYLKRHKIIFDKENLVEKVLKNLEKYYEKHPETIKFWRKKLSEMKEAKRKGRTPENTSKIYDDAERLFSKEQKITRNFF